MRIKKVTVRDIAKESGVSIATVSRYLNQDFSSMSMATRARIHDVVERSGYVNTRTKSSGVIGAVIPGLSDPYFASLIEQLTIRLEAAGFTLLLKITQDSAEQERKAIRSLLSPSVSGIIYMSTVTSEENCIELLRDAKKPFVMLDSYMSEYNAPALVFSDGTAGMYEAANYLIQLGHRDIAYLSGLQVGIFEHYRYQGYVSALLSHGLTVKPELIRFKDFSIEGAMAAFRDLLDSGARFSAIICESDLMAAGVYQVCRQRGISIPDDLSVVGFNNSLESKIIEPQLTTVDQLVDQLAEKAALMIRKQIKGESLTDRVCKVTPKLICRESVREIPH